ncbi:MAG: hypothetical protein N3D73_01195 [Candidatus Diapherotrites archaeon]|nr:hypothetical protein [Candidatus Diapherotrites archaeon]
MGVKKTPKSVRKESLLVRRNLRELTRNPEYTKEEIKKMLEMLKEKNRELPKVMKQNLRKKYRESLQKSADDKRLFDRYMEKMAKYNYKNPRLRKAFLNMMNRRKLENKINQIRDSNIKREEKIEQEKLYRKLKDFSHVDNFDFE